VSTTRRTGDSKPEPGAMQIGGRDAMQVAGVGVGMGVGVGVGVGVVEQIGKLIARH
jgi:hypothetical protein